jgi:hypothetical protein
LEIRESARVVSLICKFHAQFLPKVKSKTVLDQLSVHLNLDSGFSIRSNRGNWGTIVFEIPKREWLSVSSGMLKSGQGIKIPIGLDTMNRTDYVDFSRDEMAHLLIAGGTGSGKTNALSLLVYFLIRQNTPEQAKFVFINAQKAHKELAPFTQSAHRLLPIAKSVDAAKERLVWLLAEMKRREIREQVDDAIFCVIDEAEYLFAAEPGTVELVERLVGTGRAVNIHVITVSNNPTASSLGSMNIKRNSLGRVVGVVDSPDAARVATGIPDSGANKLLGKGDMLHLVPGMVNRISVPEAKVELFDNIPRSESPILDDVQVDSYESAASRPVGRQPDPPDPKTVARLMIYFDQCQREKKKVLSPVTLGRQMKPAMWGKEKMHRHMVFARGVLDELWARNWRGL